MTATRPLAWIAPALAVALVATTSCTKKEDSAPGPGKPASAPTAGAAASGVRPELIVGFLPVT